MTVLHRLRRLTPALWSLGARIGAALAFTLVNVLLARRLGAADFGVIAVVSSVATLGAFVASAGLNRTLLRNVAAALATDRVHEVLADLAASRRILAATLPFGVVLTVIVAALFTTGADQTLAIAALAGVLALGAAFVLLFSDVLRGLGEVRLANLSAGRNGGALAMGLFAVLLALTGAERLTVVNALSLNAVALVASGGLLYVAFRRLEPRAAVRPAPLSPPARRALLTTSAAFAGTQIAAYLSTQVDLWVGNEVLSPEDVGAYAAALRLMTIVTLPLFAAQLTVVAKVSALHAQGRDGELETLVRRTAAIVTLPAVLLLLPCILFPAQVLSALFGDEFAAGGFALAVLAVGQLVNVVTGLCGTVLAMSGHERLVLWVTMAGAAVSAACDVVGAVVWGIGGLAVASAVTTSAMFVLLWVLARVRTGMWTHAGWPPAARAEDA